MKKNRMPGIRILHEDEDVIVVEKAAGVLAQEVDGAYSVEGALTDYVRKGQAKSRRCVYLVHRLDRETSGIMMVAKSAEVQEYFRSNWNELTSTTSQSSSRPGSKASADSGRPMFPAASTRRPHCDRQ